MKNTEVAKIAKKIAKKAFIPAYITPAGAIVAFNDDASILFTAEVEAALQDTGKTYTPAALDYTSKSGIFAGGEIATNTDCYELPVDEFAPVCTVDISTLKHIANYASKDTTRPILTGLHIGGGYIEACDGFRATRYKIDTAPDTSTAHAVEDAPAAVAAEDRTDNTPAAPAIPEAVYNAVYKAACMILALKKRNYTPTPAAVEYSEAYAREHKAIINQMQKARGHIYTSGVELIVAVYTIQNGGIAA